MSTRASDVVDNLKAWNRTFAEKAKNGEKVQIDLSGFEKFKSSQAPEIAILACADSRVAPEVLLEKGIGDIFVVRSAGNLPDQFSLASLEFSVAALGVSTLVVMGHSGCGAVKAAVENVDTGSPHLGALIKKIQEGITTVPAGDLDGAILANASFALKQILKDSEVISTAYREKKLNLIVSVYDLATGIINFVESDSVTLQSASQEGASL